MAVLDTTVLVDLSRRTGTAQRRSAWEAIRTRVGAGETLATTRFNVAELYVGIELARDAGTEREKVEFILRHLPILEFDDHAAMAYAKLHATMQRSGRLPADMDLLIATVAVANGHSLVTRNARHFVNVPGLVVHSYK